MSGHEIGGGVKQNWGKDTCAPGLGLKPPLATVHPWWTDGRTTTHRWQQLDRY